MYPHLSPKSSPHIIHHHTAAPLAYVEQSDSFITCSAGFELECYKYKTLAAASGDKQEPGKQGAGPGRWKGSSNVEMGVACSSKGLE